MSTNAPNKQLFNHVSQDTAFVIERFPYTFGQYSVIRYWVETKKAYGQRLMTQILNPVTNEWFKAKTDGYRDIVILEQLVEPKLRNCGLVVSHLLQLDKYDLSVLLQLAAYYEFTPFQKERIVMALAAKGHHRIPDWKPTVSLDYELNKRAEHKPEDWQYAVRATDGNGIPIESAHEADRRQKQERRADWPSNISRAQAPGADDDDTTGMTPEQIARYNLAMGRD